MGYGTWYNFQFEFKTANQLGFEPVSLGPKGATLTIELHFIHKNKLFILTIFYIATKTIALFKQI